MKTRVVQYIEKTVFLGWKIMILTTACKVRILSNSCTKSRKEEFITTWKVVCCHFLWDLNKISIQLFVEHHSLMWPTITPNPSKNKKEQRKNQTIFRMSKTWWYWHYSCFMYARKTKLIASCTFKFFLRH